MLEKAIEFSTLKGEVLTDVDIDAKGESILLTTQSGKVFRIDHEQDCCEHVCICDTQGNFHDIIGKVIVEASHIEKDKGDPPPEYPDSWTRTDFVFKTDDATVISKWIGESNGYYSESVRMIDVTHLFNSQSINVLGG
jgi:hypothetical protein